jgi:hypothetical protein
MTNRPPAASESHSDLDYYMSMFPWILWAEPVRVSSLGYGCRICIAKVEHAAEVCEDPGEIRAHIAQAHS